MTVTQFLSKMPFPMNSFTSSPNPVYMNAAWEATLDKSVLVFFSSLHFSQKTSVACARMRPTRNLITSRLRSVEGACRKFSLIYVSIPALHRR